MIQVNRIYLIFNRLVTKKFLVDTSDKWLVINVAILFNSLIFNSSDVENVRSSILLHLPQ